MFIVKLDNHKRVQITGPRQPSLALLHPRLKVYDLLQSARCQGRQRATRKIEISKVTNQPAHRAGNRERSLHFFS